jgi:SPP1 gp7 family putative phage head morphogenesis protein
VHPHVISDIRARRHAAHMIMQRRPSRRMRRPLPRQLPPVDARLVPRLSSIARPKLDGAGARLDAGPSDVNEIVEGISTDYMRQLDQRSLTGIAHRYASATSDFQKAQLAKQLRAAVGVDVPIGDPKIGPQIEQFTAENVRLIRSIPRRYLADVEAKVLADVAEGRRWENIADDLEERFEVSESTAQLIARDQVGKFYGSLNEARQTDLGISGFIWQTAQDNRVREAHRHLQGKAYEWDSPPDEETGEPAGADGVIPGEPVNCRCYAEPDLSSIMAELAA